MKAKGLVHKFGDNVDTDVIIPARYLNKSDEAWLASHCMEDIDADFVNKVKEGDIMVAEANFGCGSSREHAPIAIKASGISCVIASTFARIFYRNAINIGLAILECDEAARETKAGDEVEVDFFNLELQTGDMVLLCSDGLTNMVDDETICRILKNGKSLRDRVEELVETANANGGRDNISVIVIEPLADGDSYENHMKMLRNEVEHD